MTTPMRQQANAVVDALQEGQVLAVLTLHDAKMLGSDPSKTRRENIMLYLVHENQGLSMSVEDATYWLNWFAVK